MSMGADGEIKCGYCGGNTDGASVHESCEAEWSRRVNDNLCTRCGKSPLYDYYRCESCNFSSPFLDYPGGSA